MNNKAASNLKKALIVFPDVWLKFSPTILNFIYCLEREFNVKVISFDNDRFNNKEKFGKYTYLRIPKRIEYILRKLHAVKLFKFLSLGFSVAAVRIRNPKFDIVLATDSLGFASTRIFYNNTVFLSLEIENDFYMKLSKLLGIGNLIIQSEERKEFILGKSPVKTSYIQNSPIIHQVPVVRANKPKNLIFMGNVDNGNNIDKIVDALYLLPSEYKLTLGGILVKHYISYLKERFSNLIQQGRLLFHETYVEQEDIVNFLSEYYISFSLYDFHLKRLQDFNFNSSPSGKVFSSIAAGVPVIVNDITGMKIVQNTNTGILLREVTSEKIVEKILEIEQSYNLYASNCIKTALELDFKKAYDKFRNNCCP